MVKEEGVYVMDRLKPSIDWCFVVLQNYLTYIQSGLIDRFSMPPLLARQCNTAVRS